MSLVQELLKHLEPMIEKAIEEKSDALVDFILDQVALKIPGSLDDVALAAAKPMLKPMVKAWLLEKAEGISPEV